ncbi:hypothetical protein SLEP1_g28123 [Rubroshorea leprosula]|uniref:hAT-like transposase RNase-H fold domain-containing protein n=1 Tax=Rubroshorea leprosula TaxID=152421 RepID=A0AAV5JSM7_9ROSI|nr:hypothetical protein SLEP1_g28123 [Rubroshorea leprosula]
MVIREIGELLERCLKDWGIKKAFALTVDNASVNDGLVKCLKDCLNKWGTIILGGVELHMRCATHIVNLVVGDGTKLVESSIVAIRATIKYVRQSPQKSKKFKECVEFEKIESKKLLCLDVPPKWNSLYLMLDTIVKFEHAFERSKYDKYWGDPQKMNKNIFVAIVLGPRRKLDFVQYLLVKRFKKDKRKLYGDMVKLECTKLFEEYRRLSYNGSSSSNSQQTSTVRCNFDMVSNEVRSSTRSRSQVLSDYKRDKASLGEAVEKIEFGRFLNEDPPEDSKDFDVLK